MSDAKADFDRLSMSSTARSRVCRAMGRGRRYGVLHAAPGLDREAEGHRRALNEFEASLTSTEKDNISTDDAQSANYNRTAGRLGG